jgi:hypothetical protein
MFQAVDRLCGEHGAQRFFHLGDDYSDAEELRMAGYAVDAVPGLWCPEYGSGRFSKWLGETLLGLRVAGVHAEKDLRAQERDADTVLCGHTHKPAIERRDKAVYFNPGHLKSERSRGQVASFGLLEITSEAVGLSIWNLQGARVLGHTFPNPSCEKS